MHSIAPISITIMLAFASCGGKSLAQELRELKHQACTCEGAACDGLSEEFDELVKRLDSDDEGGRFNGANQDLVLHTTACLRGVR